MLGRCKANVLQYTREAQSSKLSCKVVNCFKGTGFIHFMELIGSFSCIWEPPGNNFRMYKHAKQFTRDQPYPKPTQVNWLNTKAIETTILKELGKLPP